MKKKTQDRSIATTLIRGLDVLSVLASDPSGFSASGLQYRTNLQRTTLVRQLNTLELYGLVAHEQKQYRLTEHARGWLGFTRYDEIKKRNRLLLEEIASASGELAILGLAEGNSIIHLEHIQSPRAIQIAPAQMIRHHMWYTAMGKLVMSQRADLTSWVRNRKIIKDIHTAKETLEAWNYEESNAEIISFATWVEKPSPISAMIEIAMPLDRFNQSRAEKLLVKVRKHWEHPA